MDFQDIHLYVITAWLSESVGKLFQVIYHCLKISIDMISENTAKRFHLLSNFDELFTEFFEICIDSLMERFTKPGFNVKKYIFFLLIN